MFEWLKRKTKDNAIADDEINPLPDKDKRLFKYWDSTQWRYIDPVTAFRKCQHHEAMDWDNKGTLIEAGSEPETTEYVQAICDIFDVEKYDESTGEGLTETELAGLLNHLTEWLLGVKKNTSGSSTSPEPTD